MVRFFLKLFLLVLLFAAGIAAVSLHVRGEATPYIISRDDDRTRRQVAIVPGSQVIRNTRPSAILRERLDGAIALYNDGRVSRLLLTGDGRSPDYNETATMRAYAVAAGVPEEDLLIDEKGLSTWASCLNASEQYGIQEAVLVTQPVFMDRAVYLCRAAGIDVVGVTAGGRPSWFPTANTARELAARVRAFITVQAISLKQSTESGN